MTDKPDANIESLSEQTHLIYPYVVPGTWVEHAGDDAR